MTRRPRRLISIFLAGILVFPFAQASGAVQPRTRVNGKILFLRGNHETRPPVLWVMNADGTNEMPLMSPNEMLRCERMGGTGCRDFRVRTRAAMFSPQGDLIAYSAGATGAEHLRIANTDGSKDHVVRRQNGDPVIVGNNFAWSPDGSEIAFLKTHDRVQIVELGSNRIRLVHDFDLDENALGLGALDWSPDGKQIAVATSGPGGSAGVRVVNANGSGGELLVQGGAGPEWSPLGRFIASEAENKHAEDQAIVVDVDTGTAWTLLSEDAFDSSECPTWDPDGSRLALLYDGDIYLTTPDETEITDLNAPFGSCPHWSPDGERILFGSGDLHSMANDGSDVEQLTAGDAFDEFADWQMLLPGIRERATEELAAKESMLTDEDDSATVRDPVETFVRVSAAGETTIRERPLRRTSPDENYGFFNQDVDIWAADRYRTAFLIERATLPAGVTEHSVALFFEGQIVPNCQSTVGERPCIRERDRYQGDVVLIVFGATTGSWNFAYAKN